MKIYNSIYPIRQFQIDSKLKMKLNLLKAEYPQILKDYDSVDEPVIFPHMIPIPIHHARNVKDVQAIVYKQTLSRNEEMSFLKFWEKSRQIFSFDSELTHMLSLTDIDEIPWDEIKLPFKDFYISFGNYGQKIFYSNDKFSNREFIIDGAYVRTFKGKSLIFPEGSILIDFTSKLVKPTYEEAIANEPKGFILAEPIYEFILSGRKGSTVKEAIQFGEDNFIKHCEQLDKSNFEISKSIAKENGIYGFENEQLNLYKERYFRGKEKILLALPVLFNCIFYLTQYPECIVEEFQNDTLKRLLEKLNKAKNDWSKNNTLKQIKDHGYSKIKFVRSIIKKNEESISTGREVSPNWRRGHWRNQPFGQGLSLHKYIWINPTIVRKDKGHPESGHIYEINN